MSLRQLSIQWKITLLAGLCLLGIVTLLVGLSLYRMAQSSEQVQASRHARCSTPPPRHASKPRAKRRRWVFVASSWMPTNTATVFPVRSCSCANRPKNASWTPFDTREDLTRQVKAALQANPDLLGLSLVFETDALDGKDELFADQTELGSNDKGRFALYWSQPDPAS